MKHTSAPLGCLFLDSRSSPLKSQQFFIYGWKPNSSLALKKKKSFDPKVVDSRPRIEPLLIQIQEVKQCW